MSFAKSRAVPAECATNAVVYARYSSDKQTENSIDFQIRTVQTYCEAKGLRIVGEYIDRAMSGTTDNRPDFQRMIEDAKKRQFAYIVVYRFDRFARNRYDSAIYKKQLEGYGVRVLSTEESIGTGDEGIILESIYEAMAESYSRRLSRVVTQGMRETALKGLSTGGNVSLGMKIEDHKFVIDEKTAPAVRLCFELYKDGKQKQQIANELNARGYQTKNGKAFTINSITKILQNRVYIGEHDFADVKRTCPAIISKELFEEVQQLLERNKKSYGRKVSETFFSLSGKLFCGHCGASMIGDSGTSRHGTKHFYYTCNNKKRQHTCDKKSEKKDFIEWYVCEQTVSYVLTDSNIKKIAKRVVSLSDKELGDAEIVRLEKLLANVEREIDSAANALIKTNSAALIKRINEKVELLEKQQASIEKELASLRINQALRVTVSEVEAFLREFRKGDLLDEEFRRRLIKALVNCVYLFDDKIVIYYNVRGMKQINYIDMLADVDQLSESDGGSDSLSFAPPKSNLSEHIRFIFAHGCFGVVISRG